MADTYGVLPADIAAELPGLFQYGFGTDQSQGVTTAQVTAFITTADTIITLLVERITGLVPSVSNTAAPIAKRYVVMWTIAQVIRICYTGQDPATWLDTVKGYEAQATALYNEITNLGPQAGGVVVPVAPDASAYATIGSFRFRDS